MKLVSMVDGQFFDKLEEIARYVRGNERPFGGIQLVICGVSVLHSTPLTMTVRLGDFFQLPPVPESINGLKLPVTFAFDAKKWSGCIQEMFTLTKVYRQREGGELIIHIAATF
jgi:ATP-dependent DNA helicase PIF1